MKMECPKCKFENDKRAFFCLKCGYRIAIECPQCRKILTSQARFCDKCGHPLLSEGTVEKKNAVDKIEGERKHVTVMFSNLTGYTSMSESLDPEEVKEITTHIFDGIPSAKRQRRI